MSNKRQFDLKQRNNHNNKKKLLLNLAKNIFIYLNF